MREREAKDGMSSPEAIRPHGFKENAENFWYHYKWHTLIALFLIFTLLICTLQMCSRPKYDVHVLYAGGHYVDRKSQNGDIPPYNVLHSSLSLFTSDFDGSGSVSLALDVKYVLSDSEIAKLEATLEPGEELPYAALMSNAESLASLMSYSEYYLCLFSPAVYEQYKTIGDLSRFAPLESYVHEDVSVEYYSEYAIKLATLDAYSLPGLCDLPDDTLVCLRRTGEVFDSGRSAEAFRRSSQTLAEILSYKKGE